MKNKKAFWGPFLFGVGIIAMIDGIIFHQLLQWHSVYMDTDRSHQIMSDGLFHLFSLVILFIGGILLWNRGELGVTGRKTSFGEPLCLGRAGLTSLKASSTIIFFRFTTSTS
nr:DUF2243 domain-containing protein [Bacillus licheniformis]